MRFNELIPRTHGMPHLPRQPASTTHTASTRCNPPTKFPAEVHGIPLNTATRTRARIGASFPSPPSRSDLPLGCVLHQATLAPQSVYELPGMWRDVAAFGSYGDGGHVMASETTREDVTDCVRRFVEDPAGGVQAAVQRGTLARTRSAADQQVTVEAMVAREPP